MDIWHYDPTTGELLGSGVANSNPLEEGQWLLPAYATDVAPPEPIEGRARVWLGGSWDQIADHRGETWWMADAEFNDEPVTIDALGDPRDHELTNVEPPARPVVVPPIVVTAKQIRLALNQINFRAAIESWVQGADQDTKDIWQFSTTFSRAGGPVTDAAAAHGKTSEEIDELFELAKTL